MDEKELREIDELRKTLSLSYWGEDCHIDWEETARENYQQGIRKIQDGAVVLTKEEYEDLCNEYDKVYEQAKADILGNMADGGTSCHWCIDNHKEQARKETAKEILSDLLSIVQDKRNKLAITTRDPSIGGQCKAYADMETTLREIALDISVEVEE